VTSSSPDRVATGRPWFRVVSLCAVAGTIAGADGAAAQGWTFDLHAGRASFETAPTGQASTNLTLGVRHALDRRFFRAAIAAPLTSDALFWGTAALGDRFAIHRGPFSIGGDIGVEANAHSDPASDARGWGVRGEVMPLVSTSVGPVVIEARSGGSWYEARADEVGWSRHVWSSDLRVTGLPSPGVRLAGEARHLWRPGEAYTYVGASGTLALGRAVAWGSLGTWVSGLEAGAPATAWSVGGSIPVRPRVEIWSSVGREPFDPRFLTASRTSWGLGVSVGLGSERVPPPAVGAEQRDRGRVVIRLPLSLASSTPFVGGDFTGWEPTLMHRDGGHWRLDLALSPGVYHYAFRRADGTWFVPEDVPGRRDDGMGGWVAVLVVPREP
jgi:hypothetical protein